MIAAARAATVTAGLRRIWLSADDYGIAPGVDRAIRDLIAHGRLNATSVMVVAPSFKRAEARTLADAAAAHDAAIGLHLTFTAPFSPLSQGYTPLSGRSFLSLNSTFCRAMARRFNPTMLAAEIAVQFAAFRQAFGRPPDFVDGHHHVHILPQIGDALIRVIKDVAPEAWVRQCGRAVAKNPFGDPKGAILDRVSARFRRRARAAGVRTNPAFAGTYGFRPGDDFAALFPGFLKGLPDGSVVMCHPGLVDAELKRLDPLTDLREREYAFFLGDAFPKLLAAHGLTLQRA
jgi:chitin disaccharide deacetylase